MVSDLLFRMRALFRRSAMEAELDEELRAHLEHQAEKLVQRGLSPEEAERRARLDFGDVDQVKGECRRSWGVRLIDELAAEARAGLREARRKPVFTLVSAFVLVLGLLANMMMFDGLTSVAERLSPHQQSASPELAAQYSASPPIKTSNAYPGPAVRKAPRNEPSHARPSHRDRDRHPQSPASAACEPVTVMAAAFFLPPGAGRVSAAKWMVRDARSNLNNFVLISGTWRQARPGAGVEALEITIRSAGVSYTVVEVISGNLEYPQAEGWKPLVHNARAAMSNPAQWGALAVTDQSGQCASVTESLSRL